MLKLFKHKDQLDDPQGPPPKSNHITASPVADIGRFWMQQSCTLVENPGEKKCRQYKRRTRHVYSKKCDLCLCLRDV